MTMAELRKLGWDAVDVLLVSGDAYVDHPSFGPAVIGRVLLAAGYRVGILAQPDWTRPDSLRTLGRPRLACAVSSGNMDSMVNLYTAARHLRTEDAYSPGGKTGLRPPRALTVYANLARQAFPGLPVVIGGIEASMRRLVHYDYWQDKLRPSVLADTKADALVFGMGELAVVALLDALAQGTPLAGIPGVARLLGKKEAEAFDRSSCAVLPSFEEISASPPALLAAQKLIEAEMNPHCGKRLFQGHGDRAVLVEPPAAPLSQAELDAVYSLPFSGLTHPSYHESVPALTMIQNSVTCVRGCPGGCAFCGLGLHQGRFLSSRSRGSVLAELGRLTDSPSFKGTVSDLGGPSANAYGHAPKDPALCAKCHRSSCLSPELCRNYGVDEEPMLALLHDAAATPGVKHLFINSGLRLDLAMRQKRLTAEIIKRHVSGHLKVAPEHLSDKVLRLMRKNPSKDFLDFLDFFAKTSAAAGKEQYVLPYFMANFPGCDDRDMAELEAFLDARGWTLRQCQDFMPLPMTMAAAMYHSGLAPDGNPIVVNKGLKARREQLDSLKRDRSGPRRR